MKENQLKKEFKTRDVERARNIIKKDYTSKTVAGTGYKKQREKHSEGDTWEEDGKTWTIKNGIRQTITKLDAAKKAVRIPLTCPKCGGPMKHTLAKKMYKIHGFCFDPCTVEMEHQLRKAGLFEKYEKSMLQGSMKAFTKDLTAWVNEYVNYESTFVTEHGDVEDWKGNRQAQNNKVLNNLEEYLTIINEHLEN